MTYIQRSTNLFFVIHCVVLYYISCIESVIKFILLMHKNNMFFDTLDTHKLNIKVLKFNHLNLLAWLHIKNVDYMFLGWVLL